MKKAVFFGFVASLVSGLALADPAALTTQSYVDAGLKAVYKAVDEVKADKTSLSDKANSADVYSKTDADSKFATKTELAGLENESYSAATNGGLKVNENNEFALDITEPTENAMYVYKNGVWTALDVNATFPNNYDFTAE